MRIHLITAESPQSRRLRESRLIQFPQLTMPLIAALTPRELCLRLQRESQRAEVGVDGKGRGARGEEARVEGVDVAYALEVRGVRAAEPAAAPGCGLGIP